MRSGEWYREEWRDEVAKVGLVGAVDKNEKLQVKRSSCRGNYALSLVHSSKLAEDFESGIARWQRWDTDKVNLSHGIDWIGLIHTEQGKRINIRSRKVRMDS